MPTQYDNSVATGNTRPASAQYIIHPKTASDTENEKQGLSSFPLQAVVQ